MMSERLTPRRVAVSGLLRGADLRGDAIIELHDGAIEIRMGSTRQTIPFAGLDGVAERGNMIEISVSTGDVICLSDSEPLSHLARELEWRCSALGEVTRSLRGLGSRRASPDAEHDRFFQPFLRARRQAEEARDTVALLAALDPAKLRKELERQLAACASDRHGDRSPERRALHASLLDGATALFAALEHLDRARLPLLEPGSDAERFTQWRHWAAAVKQVFNCADECWLAMVAILKRRKEAPPRRSWWRRWLRRGSAAVVALSVPVAAGAQHVTLKTAGVSADSLRTLGFDVVWADSAGVFVVADRNDRSRLAGLGYSFSTVFAPGAGVAQRALRYGPTTTRVYRSFDDPALGIPAYIESLTRTTTLLHVDTIGYSVEGRALLIVKVGSRGDSPTRPNVLFMATYHAREWAATEMALRLLKHLVDHNAQGVSPNARIDSLVSRNDVWILPVANPDGYEFTFTQDRLWRKNRSPNADGSFGVDLNRNHPAHWGSDDAGSSPIPSSETYRGTAPESEPETRAIAAFHAAHPPVVAISYHTFTGLILYPPGHEYGLLPADLGIYRALAGTDTKPAVRDNLPGSDRDHYHPAPGWNLYVTNGEYTDWAYSAMGAIAFTPELTSGFENNVFYGFEFPDDEARLQTMFTDNLPFALDAIEAAADPLRARPRTTGIPSEPLGIESVFPVVRLRTRSSDLTATTVRAPHMLALSEDPQSTGRYTKRLSGTPPARPLEVSLSSGDQAKRIPVLAANGAEQGEGGWTARGFVRDTVSLAGRLAWSGGRGTLRSPAIAVPPGMDSISVLFWTRYFGNPFSLAPHGAIRFSKDAGATWILAGSVSGAAPVYYPERVDITGVAGRTIEVEFNAAFTPDSSLRSWWLDEIAIVAHAGSAGAAGPVLAFRPTANPVRERSVGFEWPFGSAAGDVSVYDFAGRLVWRERTAGDAAGSTVMWNVAESRVANGAYVVIARGGGRIARLTLFVARNGT